MKQYTNQIQTAKLIELGFEKPKGWYAAGVTNNVNLYVNIDQDPMMFNYSVGELIEMLDGVSELEITRYGSGWGVYDELRAFTGEELIDNLCAMIVKLKEEGVI